jgi:hypothetical protein
MPNIHRLDKGVSTIDNSRQIPMSIPRHHTIHIFGQPKTLVHVSFQKHVPHLMLGRPSDWYLP